MKKIKNRIIKFCCGMEKKVNIDCLRLKGLYVYMIRVNFGLIKLIY